MLNTAPSTRIVISAKALEVGDVIVEDSSVTPGGTVLSTQGGTVLNIEADGPVVSVCISLADGEDGWFAMYALLPLRVDRPASAA